MNFILGHNNVGKTHFTFYLMLLYSLKHNIKWLVFSSENDPVQLIKKLIEFIEGKPINKIEEKDYEESKDFVYNHFKFVDINRQYTYKQLLDLAEKVKEAWDYDGLLIDPINSLKKILKDTMARNSTTFSLPIYEFSARHNISTWIASMRNRLRRKHSASYMQV